jgi:hypothetical protein
MIPVGAFARWSIECVIDDPFSRMQDPAKRAE